MGGVTVLDKSDGRIDDTDGVELGGDTAFGSRVIEHVNFVI